MAKNQRATSACNAFNQGFNRAAISSRVRVYPVQYVENRSDDGAISMLLAVSALSAIDLPGNADLP